MSVHSVDYEWRLMEDETPDYKSYDREQLIDVLNNIDRVKYSGRAKLAADALERLPPLSEAERKSREKRDLTIFAAASIEVVFWLIFALLAIAGIVVF